MLTSLLADRAVRSKMETAAASLGRPDAAAAVVHAVSAAVGERVAA
jgi:UDP-N-acetylglucosamine:LPS N-acetylglucosamine transferase